jgi:hypothetical protein
MNISFKRSLRIGLILLWSIGLFAAKLALIGSASSAQAGPQAPATEGGPPFNQEQKLEELRKKIADQKDKPAEEVFKNIQQFKGVPAARVLRIMEIGYSKSLGVNCAHCHVVDQWDKDDKPAKQIAREMADMARAINGDLLKKIKNLKGPNPAVNCTTCHRGQLKPALNLG